ncbi:MAG: YdcF family protein [Caulobacterales bacterium]|nr:YdcF family protein [Caulobacterales bacterium]
MFVISKVVEFLIEPLHALMALMFVGWLFQVKRWRGASRAVYGAAAAIFFAVSVTPLADWLAYRLETRIAPAPYEIEDVAGAIILSGAAGDGELAAWRDTYALNGAAERLTTILALRVRRPDLPILVSGGTGRLFAHSVNEPSVTRRFLAAVGVDPDSVDYEERSRNTHENAVYSAEALRDRPGPYLLVTSAAHMPRAVGAFRQAGVDVAPLPVDFRTSPPSWSFAAIHPQGRLTTLRGVVSEAVGLVSYRLLGRTNELYPDD